MLFQGASREVQLSLACGLVACASNGLIYAYSMYSTRLLELTGLSRGDVVILGVLIQCGLGVILLPITLVLRRARAAGYGLAVLDLTHAMFNTGLFVLATGGLGWVTRQAEDGTRLMHDMVMALLGMCFLMFGSAAGSTALLAMSIANHNLVHAVPDGERRLALAALSLAVALGAISFVCVYQFSFKPDTQVRLSSVFWGHTAWFLVLGMAELKWMVRVKPRREDSITRETSNPIPVVVHSQVVHQSLSTLLRHPVVLEMFLSCFFGIGVSGCFLASIGNFISPSLTFNLTILFLVSQALARLANAIIYAGGEWPHLFSVWHLLCLAGVTVFLVSVSEPSAYASAVLVGLSFGGFHSAMPVITAVGFPGAPEDYPQSFSLVMLISSLGNIVVGQISTVMYGATSLSDFAVDTTFLFFVLASVVATLSAFDMGTRLKHKTAEVVATSPTSATAPPMGDNAHHAHINALALSQMSSTAAIPTTTVFPDPSPPVLGTRRPSLENGERVMV